MQKNYPTLGCTLYGGGGVKEVFGKHLLPFIPFIHRHSRHLGGGEEVFFDEKRFCVNLGGEQMLQSLTIYLTINTLVNKLKL